MARTRRARRISQRCPSPSSRRSSSLLSPLADAFPDTPSGARVAGPADPCDQPQPQRSASASRFASLCHCQSSWISAAHPSKSFKGAACDRWMLCRESSRHEKEQEPTTGSTGIVRGASEWTATDANAKHEARSPPTMPNIWCAAGKLIPRADAFPISSLQSLSRMHASMSPVRGEMSLSDMRWKSLASPSSIALALLLLLRAPFALPAHHHLHRIRDRRLGHLCRLLRPHL